MSTYSNDSSEKALKVLISAGKITVTQYENTIQSGISTGEFLDELLAKGICDEEILATIFSRGFNIRRFNTAPHEVNPQALQLLDKTFLEKHRLVPFGIEDRFLQIAVVDPIAMKLTQEIKNLTQLNPEFYVAKPSQYDTIILTSIWSGHPTGQQMPSHDFGGPITPKDQGASYLLRQGAQTIETSSLAQAVKPNKAEHPDSNNQKMTSDTPTSPTQATPAQQVSPQPISTPPTSSESSYVKPSTPRRGFKTRWNIHDVDAVVEFCDQVLKHAISDGVSDIHIEPYRDSARIRMRKDGSMEVIEMYTDYLFHNYSAVTTRFKILAGCDISEKRLPQDGAITLKDDKNGDVDFRFNVVPTKNGERIVMRILAGDPALSLEKIGLDPADYEKVIEAITSPQGMVLVTGPTGSGKTTTLYGALQHINAPDINILTAEDPVEYYLEGAGQVQANDKIGLTFNSILRAFLRQDPEVILVGEIRDQETIDIAIKAALTGHLLLSTLHTNDAISTITRILNMGVPNFMIASALSIIVAQRLARKNCPDCRITDKMGTPEVLKRLGFTDDEIQSFSPKVGQGCPTCKGTGLKGRQGIYEVLRNTSALEEAILRNEQAPQLLEAARKDGFKTMQEIGRNLIKSGVISIEEYQRTLVMES